MSLEEDIQQSGFNNEYEKLVVNIAFTQSHINVQLLRALKPLDISTQQFNVLRILKGAHPDALCLSDISSRMVDKSSNASRLVEKLKQKGLVDRKPCDIDRRQINVVITSEGRELLKEANEAVTSFLQKFNALKKKNVEKANDLLDELRTL